MSRKVIATIGTFDGVHRGHQLLLQELTAHATSAEDRLLVFTFSPAPVEVLAPERKPSHIYLARVNHALLGLDGELEVIVLPFTRELAKLSAETFMQEVLQRQYGVTDLILGYDSRFGAGRLLDFDGYKAIGERLGISVFQAPSLLIDERPISSTWVKELIQAGEIKQAEQLLSRSLNLYGRVISGNQIGRTLGYPTANIGLEDEAQLVPPAGVYACTMRFTSGKYPASLGMLYIGHRPTIGGELRRSIEVHLLGFDAMIYDEVVEVTLHERLHGEKKFDSLEELRAALSSYEQDVRTYFRLQSYLANETHWSSCILRP